jgi:hypothetical protein
MKIAKGIFSARYFATFGSCRARGRVPTNTLILFMLFAGFQFLWLPA